MAFNRRHIAPLAVIAVLMAFGPVTSTGAAVRSFKNCTAMNRVYPHGVGRTGARDHTSGTPVTNFRRSNAGYSRNRARDRDRDGIACEKL
jgi:hypothetical protein